MADMNEKRGFSMQTSGQLLVANNSQNPLLYNNLIYIRPMSYEATVEFKFNSTYTHDYTRGFGSTVGCDDFVPEEHFLITAPAADLNAKQYFKLFEKFMLAVGMSPDNIRGGAMSLVLNEWVNDADQRKICDEYEVTRNEDLHEKFKEWKERDEEIESIRNSRITNETH
jgi:hypothetical protein